MQKYPIIMDDSLDIKELRHKAEEALRKYPPDEDPSLSEADKLKLVHELEVYKVELEMQQQELIKAKKQSDQMTEKYDALLDLHNRFVLHLNRLKNSIH